MRYQITLLAVAIALLGMVSIARAQTGCYEFVTTWGSCGTGNQQFGSDIGPRGLDVSPSGDLFVCDYGNQQIKHFSTSGGFINACNSGYCSDIVFANGFIYFTRPNGEVCKMSSECETIWTTPISSPGWNLNGIDLDSDGYLHVSEGYSSYVYRLDTNSGAIVDSYYVSQGCYQIASDNDGHIYIGSGAGPVTRYTNVGIFDGTILPLPPESRAECIDVDNAGNVYIGTLDHYIRKYSPTLDSLCWWGGYGSEAGKFTGPLGLAVDNSGYVYVSDGGGVSCDGNRRIQVFRPRCEPCLCGEATGDCTINVGDAVYLINYIFKGGPAPVCDCVKK